MALSLKRRIVQGTVLVSVAEGLVYGSSFVRNMILARMLTKADFGVAAAFSIIITILEFSGKLAIGRFVIQDKEGDLPDFVATAHFVQFNAGLLSALLILLLSRPLAAQFGIQEYYLALLCLSFFPLIKAFEHLDVQRLERDLQFVPSSLTEVVPQVLITLAAWPMASWLPDYRSVLVLLFVKGGMTTAMSHLLARRSYRWRINLVYIRRMLRFGWPLVINGLLMFGVFQGDQFLVASWYTMAELATYAAASSLTMSPSFFFARVLSSMMLPIMAKVQDDPRCFRQRYQVCVQAVSAFSALYSVVVVVGAEALMVIIFGAKYQGGGVVLSWLAAANAFRIIRIAPAIAALAKADSKNQMYSNLFRGIGLLPAIGAAIAQQPIWLIAASGLVGEAIAFFYTFLRLYQRDKVPWSYSLLPAAVTALAIGASGVAAGLTGVHQWPPILVVTVSGALGCIVGSIVLLVFAEARSLLISFVRDGRLRIEEWLRSWRAIGSDIKHS